MNWQEKRKSEIDKLFAILELKYSVTKAQLISKSRKKELVAARANFMNILFEIFEVDSMTQESIAELIKRNRCTFIHHRKGHLNSYKRYKNYREEYDNFKKEYADKLGQ